MPIIDVNTLSFSFSARPLLRGISLTVGDGERAALVGPNGCGKTTLLRVIRGELTPDGGSTTIRGVTARERLHLPSATCAYTTAAEYLQATLAETFALLTRFNDIAAGLADDPSSEALANEYDATLARLEATDAWSLNSRIDETLAGLGLSQVAGEGRSRRLDALSPGQVARLELAALLLTRPAVLILDEPTNHLDDGAVAYLVEQICSWQGPVLFSSHDRAFIEAVATVIYDLDTAPWEAIVTAEGGGPVPGVFRCAGAYSDYLAAKTRARAEHRRIHSAQQEEKRELTAHRRRSEELARGGVRLATAQGMAKKFFADRAAATAVRRTRHDDQRLDTLAAHEVRKPRNYDLRLTLPTSAATAGLAVSARGAAIPGRLARITFDLAFGEHLLVTGSNGAGKSTLLQWIAAGHPPHGAQQASGTIHAMGRIVCVPQQLPAIDDPLITPTFWEEGIGDLGAGILHPSLWRVPIAQLSDGNQRRVQIAVAIAQTPDILVIDEPTNYLDLATIEELERALSAWSGTLIVASHDRWLIDHWQGMRRELQPARA